MTEKQGRTNLIIEHLTVAYEEKLAMDDVSFSLENGKIFVIVGESGSGKTTLLRTVGGLLSDEGKIVSGNIFLQEKNLVHLSEKEWQNIHGSQIGYIFQNPEQIVNEPKEAYTKRLIEAIPQIKKEIAGYAEMNV